MSLLRTENISKSYGELQVLQEINLEVNQGEVLAITGKSGAGKSTLLHIMGTLDSADKGVCIIDGINPAQLPQKKLAAFRNEKLGFVFQFHHLLAEFDALQNVMMPALIANTGKKEAEKRAREILDILGVADRLSHKPSELSGGEQQRVAFARALINNPGIVMADEPSGNLDSKTSQELHQLILDLREQLGQTFILVTHNQNLTAMCDRQIILKDGRIAN